MYLTQALHRAKQQHPNRVAVKHGEVSRTYGEFVDRVARLAGALQKLGMQRGERAAMVGLNSDAYLEYQMAVPWGGGVLNPCNVRWSASEILYSLEDSASSILFIDYHHRGLLDELRQRSTTVRAVVCCGFEGELPSGCFDYEGLVIDSHPVPDELRHGADLAGIFYTGGTSGFPKGVMLSHENLCVSALAMIGAGLAKPDDIYLHSAPMFHLGDMGLALPHWMQGNTHVVVGSFNPDAVLHAIETHGATQLMMVPTMIQMMLDRLEGAPGRNLQALRTIVCGAAPIPHALLERAMAVMPQVDFVQAYGMTEMSPLMAVNPSVSSAWPNATGKVGSGGRAIHCVELKIVGSDDCEVPRGTVGEIVARGPTVMQGYLNNEELTRETVREGWMHTGDAGWMDEDGFIFIVDRMKDMIITGGENVYSAEVENVLMQHSSVDGCAVVGIPSDLWGESVHAFVVLRTGHDVAPEDLITHCRTLIAGYKCPRSVDFVDNLPISGAGKVLKASLRKRYLQGKSDRTVVSASTEGANRRDIHQYRG